MPPSNAAEWFDRMDRAVRSSAALAVPLRASFRAREIDIGNMEGSVHLAPGGRMDYRLKGSLPMLGQGRFEIRVVSDGHTLAAEGLPSRRVSTPEGLTDSIQAMVSHVGFSFVRIASGWGSDPPAVDPRRTVRLEGLTLGPADLVHGRMAQSVRYTQTFVEEHWGKEMGALDVVVWIDAETFLPLKKIFRGQGAEGVTVEEEYEGIESGGPVDPARFELPAR